jgi:hypothetical protein
VSAHHAWTSRLLAEMAADPARAEHAMGVAMLQIVGASVAAGLAVGGLLGRRWAR